MKLSLCILLTINLPLIVLSQNSCPTFPASFLAVSDIKIDIQNGFSDPDPELTFLKDVLKLRDDAVQHTIEDVIKFFNESYGLDFSLSPPNENNEYFYQNATLSPFRVPDRNPYVVLVNYWIQTGSTRSNCYRINDGGFQVTFSSEQILYGSYGGTSGLSVNANELVVYGFYLIEACEQSPILIQFQSAAPARWEPVDGTGIINCALYSRVLGHGQARGIYSATPDPENPNEIYFTVRNAFTFN